MRRPKQNITNKGDGRLPVAESAAAPSYRRRSVTIASVGLQTNLELLLRSAPDEHSPLTGRELVAEKVALLAVMAGD